MSEGGRNETTPVVDAISKLRFEGNIIPHAWYQNITEKGRHGTRPDLVSITILSEICYWYRQTIVKDEDTGAVIGRRKKFREDKLQKTYAGLAAQFGISKGMVKEAIDSLCDRGLLTVEFRNVADSSGYVRTNMMYIEPIPAGIDRISLPKTITSTLTIPQENNTTSPPCSPPPPKLQPMTPIATAEDHIMYLESSSETSTKDISSDAEKPTSDVSLSGNEAKATKTKSKEQSEEEKTRCEAAKELWEEFRGILSEYTTEIRHVKPMDFTKYTDGTIDSLTEFMALRIDYYEKAKIPADLTKWAEAIDKMLRIDKISQERLNAVIGIIFNDGNRIGKFWGTNIQSAPNLREHFVRIEEQCVKAGLMQTGQPKTVTKQSPSNEPWKDWMFTHRPTRIAYQTQDGGIWTEEHEQQFQADFLKRFGRPWTQEDDNQWMEHHKS